MRWAMILLLLAASAAADYQDPFGLPSGSATLGLATQDSIQNNGEVEGLDVATGEVLAGSYLDLVQEGEVDLVFFDLDPESPGLQLRALEGDDYFDRLLIFSFADSLGTTAPLESVTGAEGEGVEWAVHEEALEGCCYLLLQLQEGAEPEVTAVKFRITLLEDESLELDWVWQPNGSMDFVPSAALESSLGSVKLLY